MTLRALWMVLPFALTGCAAGNAVFNSKAELEDATPIQRLLVFDDVQGEGFLGDVHAGFERELRNRLVLCGLKPQYLRGNPLGVDPVEQTIEESKPDAVLMLRRVSGTQSQTPGGPRTEVVLDLTVVDAATRRNTWRARSRFELTANMYVDARLSGERFAQKLVARLRDDGVLKSCPVLATEK